MRVSEAKQTAREWVLESVADRPDFAGAFFFGSAVHKGDDEAWGPSSDLDLRVVLDRESVAEFPQRKLLYRSVLLEVVYDRADRYRDLEALCAFPFMVVAMACFTEPNVILDPTGRLTRIGEEVRAAFRKASWVSRRCTIAEQMALDMLDVATNPSARLPGYARDLYRQVVWFYGGAMPLAAQIPCIANLQGMTLRKGFVVARDYLAQLGRADLYGRLLEAMGVYGIAKAEVRTELDHLAEAYDYAVRVIQTPFYGDYDVQAASRVVAVGGAQDVLEAGHYREIVPWIAVMRAFAQNAIDNDGEVEAAAAFRSQYQALLERLGASSTSDLERKVADVRGLLPEIMALAEEIIASHPDIVHGA